MTFVESADFAVLETWPCSDWSLQIIMLDIFTPLFYWKVYRKTARLSRNIVGDEMVHRDCLT